MTEHTQEPWSERADSLQFVTVSDASCQIVAQVPRRPGSSYHANARRIVACVNACTGIPTETLEKISLSDIEQDICLGLGSEEPKHWEAALSDALAKLRGEG